VRSSYQPVLQRNQTPTRADMEPWPRMACPEVNLTPQRRGSSCCPWRHGQL